MTCPECGALAHEGPCRVTRISVTILETADDALSTLKALMSIAWLVIALTLVCSWKGHTWRPWKATNQRLTGKVCRWCTIAHPDGTMSETQEVRE